MARRQRNNSLESRTARLKLAVRRRPYPGAKLARGKQMQYRRNKGNGTWLLKVSDGHGKPWTKAFAQADDFDDSDNKTILTFFEAQDVAKGMTRGEHGSDDNAPITVCGALTDYRADLEARRANPYNAEWPRLHLTSVLLSKPVVLLTSAELKKWRDGLLGTMAPSTINRLCRCLCAALEQAAQHDKRIQNRDAWETGLAGLPNTQEVRNVIISDDKVREFIAAAYYLDHQFGLLTDTLAITGARPSQAVRLRVEDLHDHPVRPKLMMPKSAKGGDRNRTEKKLERYSVPITVQLAARLREEAKGRAGDAPLFLQGNGSPWGDNPGAGYHREVKQIVSAIGADPDATMYALRHSSIVRMLKANVPIRLVASLHNTSTKMIEKHYSKYITEHSDDVSRHALLNNIPHEPGLSRSGRAEMARGEVTGRTPGVSTDPGGGSARRVVFPLRAVHAEGQVMPPQETRPEAGSVEEPDETFGEIDEAFVKEWNEKRTTAVPARVYQEEILGIDEELKSRIEAPRGPRIRSHLVDDVVPIGRRVLEVAINEAVSQEELHPRRSELEPDWSRIADASQDAGAALARLFRAIDPHGKEAEHLAPFIRQSRTGGFEASKAGYRDAAESALRDAGLLVEAKQRIGKLHADTLTRRDALVAIYPNSFQDHQKRGFVRIFAEGWVFLTGEMPGKHRDPLKNPFLRVVEAAWTDWHHEDSNSNSAGFGEALDAAISSIDEARLNELRAKGPEWAAPRLMAWRVRL